MCTPGWAASKESAAAWSQALDGSVNVITFKEPDNGCAVLVVVVVVVDAPGVDVVVVVVDVPGVDE